jgi:tetratricopeptide (TPR) repeat protein
MDASGLLEEAYRLFEEEGRSREALKLTRIVLKRDPLDKDALMLAAECAYRLNHVLQVFKYIERSIKAYPDWGEPYDLLGSLYMALSMPDEALKSFDRAIELWTEDDGRSLASVYFNKIELLRGYGLEDEADDAISEMPRETDDDKFWYNLLNDGCDDCPPDRQSNCEEEDAALPSWQPRRLWDVVQPDVLAAWDDLPDGKKAQTLMRAYNRVSPDYYEVPIAVWREVLRAEKVVWKK